MKRIIKIIAVIIVTILFATACNQYVCPAYANSEIKISNKNSS